MDNTRTSEQQRCGWIEKGIGRHCIKECKPSTTVQYEQHTMWRNTKIEIIEMTLHVRERWGMRSSSFKLQVFKLQSDRRIWSELY